MSKTKIRPDEVLFNDMEMPRRWCPRCDTYRLFSQDATFCLSCGAYRHDEFKPVNFNTPGEPKNIRKVKPSEDEN